MFDWMFKLIYIHCFCFFIFQPVTLIQTHLFWVASSSLQSMPPPLQSLFHLLPTLTTDHNVVCKHQRLLYDLSSYIAYHHHKKGLSHLSLLHLIGVSLPSNMYCTILTYCSSLSHLTSSYSTTDRLLGPYHMISLDPQRQSATPTDLLCTSALILLKQTSCV